MKLIISNFKHYLKSSKAVFLFNIAGFTVAFTAFFVIAIQVYYDFSYNKNFAHSNEIHQFIRYHHANGGSYWTINQQLSEEIKDKIPEIRAYCLLQQTNQIELTTEVDGEKRVHTTWYAQATQGFFDVFTPQIISGSIENIFEVQGKALISEETAKQIFGDKDPLGQTLQSGESTFTVAAIYKDFPENCTIENGIFSYMFPNEPMNWNYHGYFLIEPGTINTVKDKLNSANIIGEEAFRMYSENPEERIEYQLPALKDIYLHGHNKRINTTLSLLAIGIILLLIAFINYTNFAISMAPARIRNINIHKIFGVDPTRLRLVIASEAVLFTLLSLVLSLVYLHYFKGSGLASNFVADLSIENNWQLITGISMAVLGLSLLIGIYPAIYTTSFNEAFAMKGSFSLSPKGVILRNSLILFQFTASIALICISGMIKMQNDYMQNYSWGFQKENIAYLHVSGQKVDPELLGDELKQSGSIIDYTLSWNLPGRIGMTWSRNYEGKYVDYFAIWAVTPNFLDFFGVEMVAGDNFPKERDREKIIFNEEFMKVNDFSEDLLRKEFFGFSPADVIGVAENINFQSLHEPIKPMAFVVFPSKEYYNYLYLKLSGNDLPANIAQIEQTWKKFTDKPFDLRFLDNWMDNLYKNEINTGNLISVFGLISVLIAMMGVYGLVLFNTRYKTKEIAIRKINGANESEILRLLNKNMLRLLLASFVVAVPIALLVIHNWMERFAYKATVPWWLFVASGLMVLLITIATVSWQSYRAAISNPVDSLKTE